MILPLGLALAKSRGPRVVGTHAHDLGWFGRDRLQDACHCARRATVTLLWLRPRDVVRLLPLMIPMLIVIKIAAPGAIATVKNSFFPQGGLFAEQSQLAGDPTLISGRANFKPRLREGMRRPILGQGLGTRQTGIDNPLRNAPILDNQWLGLFLDVGLLGVIGWLWLIVRTSAVLVAPLEQGARRACSPLASPHPSPASPRGCSRLTPYVRPGGVRVLGASGARRRARHSSSRG